MSSENSMPEIFRILNSERRPIFELLQVLHQATSEASGRDDHNTLSCVRAVLKQAVRRMQPAINLLIALRRYRISVYKNASGRRFVFSCIRVPVLTIFTLCNCISV